MAACIVPLASKAPRSFLPCCFLLWGESPIKRKGFPFLLTFRSFLKGFFCGTVPLKAGEQLHCQCLCTALEPFKERCLIFFFFFLSLVFFAIPESQVVGDMDMVFSLCLRTAWNSGSQAQHYNACTLAQILKISIFTWKTLFKHPLWMIGKAS